MGLTLALCAETVFRHAHHSRFAVGDRYDERSHIVRRQVAIHEPAELRLT